MSAVNGKSVKSLYGVTYLYAAAGLFKTVPVSKYASCASSTSGALPKAGSKALSRVKTDTMLTVVATVSGRSYDTTCAGKRVVGLELGEGQRGQRQDRQVAVRGQLRLRRLQDADLAHAR